ncbi:HAD family hydrolase [Paenibacillus glycanilyticus]|uniref:Haloacid dehalogenase n=1 Tax=Paenibacillus glycanilyticus TaxID=126569 RepID=A0ABQ6GKT7_9BACL|nr:HAD family hydrolase [Paenibacillus glycanilyticus]GLX71536.1 haloacid dehalogenase [Paenibacillus glycanilyticus]
MRNLTAVIFDLDQTLLDKDCSLVRFADHQYDSFQLKIFGIDKAEFIHQFTLMNHVVRPKEEVYKELIELFQIDPSLITGMLEDLNRNFARYAVGYPGLIEMLEELKASSFQLGMITNGRVFYQRNKIQSLGIENFFDEIIISEAVGLRKPDPAIFQLALTKLGVAASQSVFVGDNLKADIIPAKELGMATIWKQKNTSNEAADIVCDDLRDMAGQIQKLMALKTG